MVDERYETTNCLLFSLKIERGAVNICHRCLNVCGSEIKTKSFNGKMKICHD